MPIGRPDERIVIEDRMSRLRTYSSIDMCGRLEAELVGVQELGSRNTTIDPRHAIVIRHFGTQSDTTKVEEMIITFVHRSPVREIPIIRKPFPCITIRIGSRREDC